MNSHKVVQFGLGLLAMACSPIQNAIAVTPINTQTVAVSNAALQLADFLGSDLDCGGSDEVGTVKQISRENTSPYQFSMLYYGSDEFQSLDTQLKEVRENITKGRIPSTSEDQSAYTQQLYSSDGRSAEEKAAQLKKSLEEKYNVPEMERLETELQSRQQAMGDKFQEDFKNAAFELSAIRMKSKDSDTGAITCAAILKVNVPGWGSSQKDISYLVENTSDGQIYVTVYGLN